MSSDRQMLLEMGFDEPHIDWALRATKHAGLQPALDFLVENAGKPVPESTTDSQATMSISTMSNNAAQQAGDDADDEDAEALRALMGKGGGGAVAAAATAATGAADDGGTANSIKCVQCGKQFRDTALANFHAEKSGHDQFEESIEEIRPLTEEERQQRVDELRAKLAEKRAVREKEEKAVAQANEALRRKAGKDAGSIKEELHAKEVVKEVERKRKEKEEDLRARQKIREQIARDKEERRRKAEEEKAMLEGRTVPAAPAAAPVETKPAVSTSAGASQDYKETRLQIRLASGGKPYTVTLQSDSTLQEVAEYLAMQTLGVNVDTVSFAMQYPRKQFSRSDFSKTLRDLGLTPSAVLIAS